MAIPLIAPVAGAIIGGLVQAAGSIVGRVLIALGIGVVTYTGLTASLDVFKDTFTAALGDAGPVAAGIMGTLKFDVAFAIIVSAVTARLAIKGLTGDSVKRMILEVIELTTGLPGSGKTLYTICRVKQKSEAENRPVYYSGIPDLKLPWIQLDDPTQWHTLPANSICVIDEAQRVFRPRGNGSQVPEHVEKLETHRHQGIDLIIITQHPMLIDSNVRRLVGQHYHVSRPFGWKKAKIFRFESARENPLAKQNEGSRIDFIYPKQAFDWYKSAEVHTVKARLPWQVVAMFALPALAIGLMWWFYSSKTESLPEPQTLADASGSTSSTHNTQQSRPREARKTTAEYVREQQPRIAGLAYTAPVYDEVTKPVHAPYPAACVVLRGECRCYTQQGTRLGMDRSLCENIVKEGFFIAWDTRGPEQRDGRTQPRQVQAPVLASADTATVSSIAIPAPPPPAPLSETAKTAQIDQQPYQPKVPASSPWSAAR